MIRILIADPDAAAREALILLLQRKLGTNCIIELLLDWRLYGSPAPETCRLLRKAYPQLEIVLLSVDANDATAAKEAGAGFIHKGASPDELITTLTPLLRKE